MKKIFSNESANRQSSTLSRYGKTFLMKPAIEANSFMCTEFNFDQTLECPRVILLQDYLNGIEDLTEKKLYKLLGNQPVFYFQERFAGEEGYEWNGMLLFRTTDKQLARELVMKQAEDLNIVLAFDNPLDNRYYMLLRTGTEKFNASSLKHNRFKYKAILERHLPSVQWMATDYFIRAFTEEHYDVVNRDALFGTPQSPYQLAEAAAPAIDDETRACKPQSVGEACGELVESILRSFFGRFLKRTA